MGGLSRASLILVGVSRMMTMRTLILALCIAAAAASPIGSTDDEWVEKKDLAVQAQQVFEDAAKTQIFEARTMRDVAKLKAEMSSGQEAEEELVETGCGKTSWGRTCATGCLNACLKKPDKTCCNRKIDPVNCAAAQGTWCGVEEAAHLHEETLLEAGCGMTSWGKTCAKGCLRACKKKPDKTCCNRKMDAVKCTEAKGTFCGVEEWNERSAGADLIEAGWGTSRRRASSSKSGSAGRRRRFFSKPTSKTLSMDVDAASMGAKAGVCVQAKVPSWVPTAMMNKGMNLVWNTKLGKRIAASLSKFDVKTTEFKVEEKACSTTANPKTFFTYTKNLPFIGTVAFSIHGSAAFDLNKEQLAQTIAPVSNDLEQDGYGSWTKKKNTERSMDLDVYPAGIPKELSAALKQSMCFQGTIPSWIPTSVLSSGMKLILQDKILKALEAKGMKIEPDKDTEFVATGACDRKENPSSLLTYTKDLPFVGRLTFSVFGTEALKQMNSMFGGGSSTSGKAAAPVTRRRRGFFRV